MKQAVVFFIFLLPIYVFSGNNGGVNQEQIQKMMQQVQGLQTCMQNIDQSEMQAFEQRAKQMEAETQALCVNGKRDEAMRNAMTFGKEMSGNKAIQEMAKCGEGMKNMMPKISTVTQNGEKSGRHICDEL